MTRAHAGAGAAVLAALCASVLGSCAPPAPEAGTGVSTLDRSESESVGADLVDPPAGSGAFAPNLSIVSGGLAATWLEPFEPVGGETGHRVRFARLEDGVWSEAVTIAQGVDLFANWADFPASVQAGDGTVWAHWLAKTARDTYAYSVFLARSTDGGSSWQPAGKLNSDDTPTEHGFVSFIAEAEGARAFWLDGRGMVDGGPMTLRTTRVGAPPSAQDIVDSRVCECCGTDAALADAGPVVVYRDRSDVEVRDIVAARRSASGWSEPAPVHADGWSIQGCPVNGPAIDASGSRVAVAWFTGSDDRPRVQIAFSSDSGATFGEPVVVDASGDNALVLGRVDVVFDAEGSVWMSWLTQVGDEAEIRVERLSAEETRAERRVVARTSPARASGFPVLESAEGRLWIAWVEVGEDRAASRVHVRAI